MWRLLLVFLLIGPAAWGQQHVLKGRVFATPIPLFLYSLGLGYEHVFANNLSVQVLYNNYGYSNRNMDGNAVNTQGVVPEARYYIGKQESFRQKFFVGVYTEVMLANETAGYAGQSANGTYQGAQYKMLNPGILAGKNISLGKHWHFDVYLGWKYKFMNISEKYSNNGEIVYVDRNEQKAGMRLGLNLAWVF